MPDAGGALETLCINGGGRQYIQRTRPDISSSCYYKHYPNTLALVGRSLTFGQGPGSAQRFLFRHAGILVTATAKSSHRPDSHRPLPRD